jgi:hypothetical protein
MITDALADQLVGIATSPALAHELRRNIHTEYAHISWDDVARQCIDLYERANRQGVAV